MALTAQRSMRFETRPSETARARTTLRPRGAWIALAVLIVMHALMAYGLSGTQVFIVSLVFMAMALFFGAIRSLIFSLAFAGSTLVAGVVVAAADAERGLHYRPTDFVSYVDYEALLRRYTPDVSVEMRSVGDLHALGAGVREERTILLRTDGDGWRNEQDYRGEPWLAVGGGLVAGIGNTQSEILTARLEAEHGIPVYNLAHPGGILDYERYLEVFREQHGGDVPAFLFFSEGDFPEVLHPPEVFGVGSVDHLRKRYTRMFSRTTLYRMGFLRQERWRGRGSFEEASPVLVLESPLGDFAFGAELVGITQRPTYEEPEAFVAALERMRPRLAGVFFVPTKYRVFQRTFHVEEDLPHAQWDALARICAELDLPCIDLTGSLVEEAAKMAQDDAFPFWKDDTHWNAAGIAVAAQAVADLVATASD